MSKEGRRRCSGGGSTISVAGGREKLNVALSRYSLVAICICFLSKAVQCAETSQLSSQYLLKDLYTTASAPFEASPDSSEACRRDTEIFRKELSELEIWALKMYDAAAKPPSGILSGNTNQFGDFFECLNVRRTAMTDADIVSGQYCLATFVVEQVAKDSTAKSERLHEILDAIHSHRAMKSTFEDGPSFFPSFIPISWGVCVPSSCSEKDVALSLSARFSIFNSSSTSLGAGNERGTDIVVKVKVEEGACQVTASPKIRPGTIFAVLFFLSVILFAAAGTIYDIKTTEKQKHRGLPRSTLGKILIAYSVRRNLRNLLKTGSSSNKGDENDISCVHGIRAIFSVIIYTIHKIVFGLFIPFTNRTYIAELLEYDWTMVFRAFWNNVDTFVILSGLLTSYFSVKKLQGGKSLNIPNMYIQRYFKFTPMFLAVVLIVGQLIEQISFGPQTLRVTNYFVNNCQSFSAIIKSIFYVSNMDGMENMCYPPSHQLITDMQMYLSAPFFVLALWKWPRSTSLLLAGLVAVLASYKYTIVHTWKLNSVIYNGVSISELKTGANLVYLNPIHRLTPYIFGVYLGYFLRTTGNKSNLNKAQLFIGWCLALFSAYYSFFGANGASRRDYVQDVATAAIVGSLQPILWSYALSWIIYVCYTGKARSLNRILSWKGFVVFSRLSYSIYMVQIVIIFYKIGTTVIPEHFSFHKLVDLNEIMAIATFSISLTLLFLMPLGDLWKIVSGTGHQKESETSHESKKQIEVKNKSEFTMNYLRDNLGKSPITSCQLRRTISFSKKNEDDFSRNT